MSLEDVLTAARTLTLEEKLRLVEALEEDLDAADPEELERLRPDRTGELLAMMHQMLAEHKEAS